MKVKNVKMKLKNRAIMTEDLRNLTQGMVDGLRLAVEALENDPSSMAKHDRFYEKREKLQQHFETLEKNAKQLSHANCLHLDDNNTAFFREATKA